nr:diguanylate cyclase [Armatimonadota bacterium]
MKILIAEDDTLSRMLLSSALQQLGHEVEAVKNGNDAWEAFLIKEYSIIISDRVMPDMDGLELCRQVRAAQGLRYTYLILLAAQAGKTDYTEAMNSGADDFLIKPFDAEQLRARLRVAERILDLQEKLRTQAMHDSLTGLYNRAAILDHLQQELDRAAREKKCVAVFMVDLDHFKDINDTFGHSAGDIVLRESAQRMQRCLRSYDRIGRYGGEEFLIIAPGCTGPDCIVMGERVRDRITGEMIHTPEGDLSITGSLGIAVSDAGNPRSADTI